MRYFLVAVLFACCSKQPEARWLDAERYLGKPVHVGALTVWPIHSEAAPVVDEFLTLQEAQTRELAAVREVSEEGEVGSLVVKNKGSLPILVCAGTVVRGGKQDRQIGQDFVIEPDREVTVDAFCVEQARWQAVAAGDGFNAINQMAVTSVRAAGQYENDQQGVWEDVAGFRNVLNDANLTTTGAVTIVFDSSSSLVDALAVDEGKEMREKITSHFAAQENAPVGFAYAIDGKPVCVRTFAHSRLLTQHLDAFVRTMCLEAAPAKGKRRGVKSDVIAFVKAISKVDERLVETRASNVNGYREGKDGWNASCYLRRGTERVKLSEDWTAKQ